VGVHQGHLHDRAHPNDGCRVHLYLKGRSRLRVCCAPVLFDSCFVENVAHTGSHQGAHQNPSWYSADVCLHGCLHESACFVMRRAGTCMQLYRASSRHPCYVGRCLLAPQHVMVFAHVSWLGHGHTLHAMQR
jgi:hypothetical protein